MKDNKKTADSDVYVARTMHSYFFIMAYAFANDKHLWLYLKFETSSNIQTWQDTEAAVYRCCSK